MCEEYPDKEAESAEIADLTEEFLKSHEITELPPSNGVIPAEEKQAMKERSLINKDRRRPRL